MNDRGKDLVKHLLHVLQQLGWELGYPGQHRLYM